MSGFKLAQYTPSDTLWLWWLGQPDAPRLVGELRMARQSKGVSLRYAPEWLRAGFALSEDLPLIDSEFLPTEKETAAGAVDDARPDRWGERVIRMLDKPPRLAVLDFLFYAGDQRFGALGVSVSPSEYLARDTGPLPQLVDAPAMQRLVQQIVAGEPVEESLRRLIAPGVTLGGARPKALLNIDGHPWVIKFNEPGESIDWPLVEHATMTLAAQAGIRVARTRPVPLQQGHAIAIQRFDREAAGLRRHALSANVALKAAGEALGYPELAQLLRRRGVAASGLHREQMKELFRRMVFNILIDNTDDHEKNHALLMTESGEYALSPAFDVLPSGQALGYQQMRVGAQAADATLDNALSECAQFGLKRAEAQEQVRAVCAVVDGWRAHFERAGVSPGDIQSLAQQIDRAFLLDQRQAASVRRGVAGGAD
ncbi:serine/threonine-protein kinase HipA [Hydrogenophaga palleronii]|uniref:Serine/threonine-protein kinase HipA n=1 Tax=Hydrogenophaga palleronii TaxID=65655 RepID=A0ABU1WVF6_9BURK|nr:HipA domain-containing protein [Hydrogenophaga palleronii]MDR7152837.1 serine/threonine-protein kinase HipA [Hydrogenophaga palleronii]